MKEMRIATRPTPAIAAKMRSRLNILNIRHRGMHARPGGGYTGDRHKMPISPQHSQHSRVDRLVWAVVAAILGYAGWTIYGIVAEAYGAGPPYYGRTTNMDKWEAPWADVAVVGIAAIVAIGLVMALRRRFRGRSSPDGAR